MNTKKAIPFLFSILAIASMASIGVLGNTQTAFAGSPPITSCTITPVMVNLNLGPNESVDIPKTIDCDQELIGASISSTTCQLNDVTKGPHTILPFPNSDVVTFDETIQNLGNISEEHCVVVFVIEDTQNLDTFVTQQIWINEVPAVGGQSLPIDSIALMLAGLQSSAIWVLPVLAVAAGTGAFYIKTRMNKD